MKKILLTRQEEAAVRATRMAWRKVEKEWKIKKEESTPYDFYRNRSCPLCRIAGNSCGNCLYYRIMGFTCEDYDYGHYEKWGEHPTPRTCKSIITLLDKMLENSKALREKKRK